MSERVPAPGPPTASGEHSVLRVLALLAFVVAVVALVATIVVQFLIAAHPDRASAAEYDGPASVVVFQAALSGSR